MITRSIEDHLREEYFRLLPHIKIIKEQIESEVKYDLLPILNSLKSYERLEVCSRVKECESAIDSLRRRQEGATFDQKIPENYSLSELRDLAGVRVLVFPRGLINRVDNILKKRFDSWESDPVPGFNDDDEDLALKYIGHTSGSKIIYGELQIAPMLTGLFWKVEHSAIYKPKPEFKGALRSFEMQQRCQEVLNALKEFEKSFERIIDKK